MMERGPLLDASLAELSKTYVACRMTGGDKDASPGIDVFMERYGVQGFPTCLVLSAEGALLKTVGNVVQPPEILAGTREAAEVEADFQAFRAAVEKLDQPALAVALARAYGERRQVDRAVGVWQKIAAKDPSPSRLVSLARAQAAAGERPAAMATWDKLIAGKLSGPESVGYRVERASVRAAGTDVAGAVDDLQKAADVAGKAGNPADAKGLTDGAGQILWEEIMRLCNVTRDFKQAVTVLDRLLKDFGQTPAAGPAKQFEDPIRGMAKR